MDSVSTTASSPSRRLSEEAFETSSFHRQRSSSIEDAALFLSCKVAGWASDACTWDKAECDSSTCEMCAELKPDSANPDAASREEGTAPAVEPDEIDSEHLRKAVALYRQPPTGGLCYFFVLTVNLLRGAS
uniref:Uncharacterized protein n=1 Tax=Alexandrium catenella TaxID=2925 RepID=A0A7S1RI56_ALECA|mmetsp:Transcript_59383/g.159012  ORF Transcript_59383/g.159012 Transcript_59383/m.159012 type:complete len:131 (+) Transcript_59383:3-395(+)